FKIEIAKCPGGARGDGCTGHRRTGLCARRVADRTFRVREDHGPHRLRPAGGTRMNLPNKLTLSRFVLTAAFLAVMLADFSYHETVALLLFSAASLTDYFDGKIARRDNLITNFGMLMDPLADKILVCSAFIAFVDVRDPITGKPWIAAWMVVVI